MLTRASGAAAWSWPAFCDAFASLCTDAHASTSDPFWWEPGEVHVSYGGSSAGELAVLWNTWSALPTGWTAAVSLSINGSAPVLLPATSYTYSVPQRWWDPDGSTTWLHRAALSVPPASALAYTVGATNGTGQWDVAFASPHTYAFTAPRAPRAGTPTQALLFGDQGTFALLGYYVAQQAIADLSGKGNYSGWTLPRTPDLFALVGDISYAGLQSNLTFLNMTEFDEVEWIWDLYGMQMEPITSTVLTSFTIGNHDTFYNASAYQYRYPAPGVTPPGAPAPEPAPAPPGPVVAAAGSPFWFSYEVGDVHFTSMSTEHDYAPGSPQYEWLVNDLAAAAARRAAGVVDWLVLLGHRPIYCSDAAEYSSNSPGAYETGILEPLLLRFGVDLAVNGHMHLIEFVHPNVNGTVVSWPTTVPGTVAATASVYTNPTAPLYLVVGASGALQEETLVTPAPEWSAFRAANTLDSYGYTWLSTNATHLQLVFLPLTRNAAALHEAWIVRT
jgi:hypothetical protein